MVKRNIVRIDEDKCNGCGLCVNACAEGAIQIIDGKAKLVSENYCDGLGACLGTCPEDAITVEQREAPEFDEEAVKAHLDKQQKAASQPPPACPGLMARDLKPEDGSPTPPEGSVPSRLSHWPVQLNLVSPGAPYFENADLLLVADCVPFAMGDFHSRLLKDHSVAVGCPKLDDPDSYIEKVAAILKVNKPKSLTVVHMEVPCCSGMTQIARRAIAAADAKIPFDDITIDLHGNIAKTETVQPAST